MDHFRQIQHNHASRMENALDSCNLGKMNTRSIYFQKRNSGCKGYKIFQISSF